MKAEIKRAKASIEFLTDENCYVSEVANDSGDEQVSIARVRVQPNITTEWHKLIGTSERYIITSGTGSVEIDSSEPVMVEEGDIVRIPPDIRQRIKNIGKKDLIFYAICIPPFKSSNYLEVTEKEERQITNPKYGKLVPDIIKGEIEGKNIAIHAYDKMMWTIRTGFLTLFFVGWGILLKTLIDNNALNLDNSQILLVMLLASLTLSLGGLSIDLNYLRRKFRVVFALDSLLSTLVNKGISSEQYQSNIEEYILVAGDKENTNYNNVSGYHSACKAGVAIFILPLLIAFICVFLLWPV